MYFPYKKERWTLVTKLVVVELVEVTKLAKSPGECYIIPVFSFILVKSSNDDE